MCGFVGYYEGRAGLSSGDFQDILYRMGLAIAHRGPDDDGVWIDKDAGIGLVHQRLSVLDLSVAGHQPMVSRSGRYVIAFNGEIYNHQVLRSELGSLSLSPEWRGHSDTETLLAGFEGWGVENTLVKTIGMFAFALWDRATRTLILGRDRMGEKPLYYGWQGSGLSRAFLFGSELKALQAHPAFSAEIDRGSLCLLLRHNYISTPHSIYTGISKLPPGCLLTLTFDDSEPKIRKYWDTLGVMRNGFDHPFEGSALEAVERLDCLAKEAIGQQMISDVPLGAFLSGGIDSSTVVALMQSQSARPIKTFTIGFHEEGFNEAHHAKVVANYLGTDHTELYVTPRVALDVIPRLQTLYSEPFSDSSQIPTVLVSQLARKYVTVSLSGDGGDELFAGYNRYVQTKQLLKTLSRLPKGLKHIVSSSFFLPSEIISNSHAEHEQRFSAFSLGMAGITAKLHKWAGIIASENTDSLYRTLVSHWLYPEHVVIGANESPTLLTANSPSLFGMDVIHRLMALDTITYLPDDILTKVDRAAMGVSLETRVPFIDHRIVEFAWSLPLEYKLHDGVSKWVLRQVLSKYIPKELIDRPKMGFGVPIDTWLRGPLRDWAEDLLDESRLRQEGFFYPRPIRQKWEGHLSGKYNWDYQLWNILMFQSWLDGQ